MNSCFPHLAILNPRNANKSKDRLNDECNVVNAEDTRMRSRTPTLPGKNDVFQDLDLYYVRQIARNSKVGSRLRFEEHNYVVDHIAGYIYTHSWKICFLVKKYAR